jgi:hypothetical protein
MKAAVALVLLLSIPGSGQQSSRWKEFVFQLDKFAITAPGEPTTHSDAKNPEFTVYSIPMPDKIVLNLRVSNQSRECAPMLDQLADGARRGLDGMDPSSVKTISIDGNPGVEYQWISPVHTNSDRYYCVQGKFYVFSASWKKFAARPAVIDRVETSLRLLSPDSK